MNLSPEIRRAAPRGPRPQHPSFDAAVPGPSLLYAVDLDDQAEAVAKGETTAEKAAARVVLLGAGRDAADRDDFVARLRHSAEAMAKAGIHGRLRVSKVYATIEETIADPIAEGREVKMDRTARSILHVERKTAEWREANAEWVAAVEASDREICDRCGGAGGHRGWPGYTCFECGGRGTVEGR